MHTQGLPRWHSGKESTCQCRRYKRRGFDPWVRKISWSRKWQPSPASLPGKLQGERSLVGYSPWGCEESDRPSDWAWAHSQTHTHPAHFHTNHLHSEKTCSSLHDSDFLGVHFSQIKSIVQSELPIQTDRPHSLVYSPHKETAHGRNILTYTMAYTSSFHIDNWPPFNNMDCQRTLLRGILFVMQLWVECVASIHALIHIQMMLVSSLFKECLENYMSWTSTAWLSPPGGKKWFQQMLQMYPKEAVNICIEIKNLFYN